MIEAQYIAMVPPEDTTITFVGYADGRVMVSFVAFIGDEPIRKDVPLEGPVADEVWRFILDHGTPITRR